MPRSCRWMSPFRCASATSRENTFVSAYSLSTISAIERFIDSGLWLVLLFSLFLLNIIVSRSWTGSPMREWSASFASRPRWKSLTLTISRIIEVVTFVRPYLSRSSSTSSAMLSAVAGSVPASTISASRMRLASHGERSSCASASTISARSVDSPFPAKSCSCRPNVCISLSIAVCLLVFQKPRYLVREV